MAEDYRERIYSLVRVIPKGKVMTYGQIAVILGKGYTPRTVGHAMKICDTDSIPWQRVINSQGACSTGRLTIPTNLQQKILEQEGVIFSAKGRCDLTEFLWEPQS